MGSIGPLIVPLRADLRIEFLLSLNNPSSSIFPGCEAATRKTLQYNTDDSYAENSTSRVNKEYLLVSECRLATGLEDPLLWADMDISEVMLSDDGSFMDLKCVSASEEPKITNHANHH